MRGVPGRAPGKVTHHLILSMSAGTPAAGLFASAQAFAREEFALKHRYATVLHTDQAYPHVHLVVRALGEDGRRLRIRRATLRQWRERFAEELRARGIEANATPRAVRGHARMPKPDGIYRALQRKASTHVQARLQTAAREILSDRRPLDPGLERLRETRDVVERGWRSAAALLAASGRPELAREVQRFVERLPPVRSEQERLRERLAEHFARERARQDLEFAR